MIPDDIIPFEQMRVTGTMVAYNFICQRKLWLFSKGLNFENISGNADIMRGKILHEGRFKRETHKELSFDSVKIDFLRFGEHVFVHEIKKSKKFEKAHIWQLKYYIYLLRQQGINCPSGVIHYPASMRKVEVLWENGDEQTIEQVLGDTKKILERPVPPAILEKKMCPRCAYFDFCYA